MSCNAQTFSFASWYYFGSVALFVASAIFK